MDIIPAILPKSYDELENKLETVSSAFDESLSEGGARVVQIDICDGAYVPNRTWPYLRGPGTDQIFASIVDQETALPFWESLDFEFDLMAKGAHEKIPDFISAGASRIVVHLRSVGEEELEAIVRDFGRRSDELSPFAVELGIAIMPDGDQAETLSALARIADRIHFVQVMGIDRIGFQGQEFDPRALDLIRAVKSAYPSLSVALDGHATLADAALIRDAGADRLVVGSALFESGDFLGTLREFQGI